MFKRIFLDHPSTVNETFFEHLVFAATFAGKLFVAAAAALLHALIPCLFEKTASKIITELYHKIHNRSA